MTECEACGADDEIGYFHVDGEALCRGCHDARTGGHVADRVPPGRDQLFNEYAAHDAARDRMRVIENRGPDR